MPEITPYSTTNHRALAIAASAYAQMDTFRRDRQRCKRYAYGDQWGDIVEIDSRKVTEEEFIISQGSVPLKNNLIRRLVRSVIGVHRSRGSRPLCQSGGAPARAMNALLQGNARLNRLDDVNTRTLEEFLISGLAVQRKWYGTRQGRTDCWTDYVQPNNFFVDASMRDFRGWDCSCIGEVHDIPFESLCMQFASSAAQCQALKDIYADADGPLRAWQQFAAEAPFPASFATPAAPGLCRVAEVWTKEATPAYCCTDRANGTRFYCTEAERPAIERANARRRARGVAPVEMRWTMRQGWSYAFLTPCGRVLASGASPYAHGEHPFVMKAYPLIDGEIHSFVADVIDQQRYVNRLITMYDWMARASAKGVLLVPDDCIPAGADPYDFVSAWSRHDGVMFYKPSVNGDHPQQVVSNSASAGLSELLGMQLKFFEDISGVSGALQGKLDNASMSAALYSQQTANSATALSDVLGAFEEFLRAGACKDASNMRQFYDAARLGDAARAQAFDISVKPRR